MSKDRRRQHGSGAVFKRGDRWYATLEAGYTKTGGRRRVSVSAKTEAECKRRLRDKKLQLDRDGFSGVSARTTVKQWSDIWLDARSVKLRPSTMDNYRSIVKTVIVPTIGHRRLDELSPGDSRAVIKAHRATGANSTTALKTYRVLTTMLKAARAEGHNVSHLVTSIEAPSVAVTDREALSTPEAIAILDVASTLPDGSRWVAALLQGMRQGECLGLTWEAVHLEAGVLDVSWQLQTLTYKDKKRGTFHYPDGYEYQYLEGAWHLTRPKSQRGKRVIPLVPWMLLALKAWRDIAPASPHDLVWPRLDGRPTIKAQDTEEWRGLQGAAGVGHPSGRYYGGHEARHTTATLLSEAGVAPEVITAILGHSSYLMSTKYMHVRQPAAMRAMEKIAEQLQLTSG